MSRSDKYKILSMPQPLEKVRQLLEDFAEIEVGSSLPRDELLEKIDSYDGILASGSLEYDEELFRRAGERLKIVARVGVGYDNVDVEAATESGVLATNTPGVMAESVAEHTLLLILAVAKGLPQADRGVREGHWSWAEYRGTELWCQTLGQIGLGRIGRLVANKVRDCLSMRVLAHDPYALEEKFLEIGAKSVELETVLGEADVITINAPLTEETRGLIGEKELRAMKKSAILVNTGRGPIIDEGALIEALQKGEIAGAGLDVFEQEPPNEDNPLLEMENVVLTPHQASNTETGVENMFMTAARDVVAVLKGERPKFPLNPEVIDC